MDRRSIELATGALLHDIGKILFRYNDGRDHSTSGYEFLKENGIKNENLLNQIKYHHLKKLNSASLEPDALAYITYWADNVAAGADRRKKDETSEFGFDKYIPLDSIFNVLNRNPGEKRVDASYMMKKVYDNGEPNMPCLSEFEYSSESYGEIIANIKDGLNAVKSIESESLEQESANIKSAEAYLNSLLAVLESTLSFVPSSTQKSEIGDISLFDHSKVTAAIAGALLEYLDEKKIYNYKDKLVNNKSSYDDKAFLLVSMDISGIQDFIYTVSTSGVLKTLRAKSFYLEIMLEHIVDELLTKVGLSRANLIYSGGGHAYILLSNTEKTKAILTEFNKNLKAWFLKYFRTELYIAIGSVVCSANDLMNKPEGSDAYENLFKTVSKSVSEDKLRRYSANEIIELNNTKHSQYERECKVCRSLDNLNDNNLCSMCEGFEELSSKILKFDFISITETKSEYALRLPFDRFMLMESEDAVRKRMKEDSGYVRCYSKNKMFTGYNVATKLWTGDYYNGETFEDMVDGSRGIRRIGVLRADVDNLGQAFVKGFSGIGENDNYTSLSRSSTFSLKMSMFFKLHLNYILGNGKYTIEGKECNNLARKVMIIYSGGDDIFLVGAWNEVIEAAVDINDALREFTQETLSISAGIGLFPEKYPVDAFARQTGDLEDCSKSVDGKNAVTLFDNNQTYKWDVLKEKVIGEKFALIKSYLDLEQDKGMAVLYKLLGYIRGRKERINIARLAYLLGRMEPDKEVSPERKEAYANLAKNIYKWTRNDEDARQLITAIYLYVYLNRDGGYDGKTN